jgi:hypothetical protein
MSTGRLNFKTARSMNPGSTPLRRMTEIFESMNREYSQCVPISTRSTKRACTSPRGPFAHFKYRLLMFRSIFVFPLSQTASSNKYVL